MIKILIFTCIPSIQHQNHYVLFTPIDRFFLYIYREKIQRCSLPAEHTRRQWINHFLISMKCNTGACSSEVKMHLLLSMTDTSGRWWKMRYIQYCAKVLSHCHFFPPQGKYDFKIIPFSISAYRKILLYNVQWTVVNYTSVFGVKTFCFFLKQ